MPLPPNRDATKTIPTTDYQATIDKDHVYRQIAEELETGSTDKGLWIRLFAECGGDEKQTKVLYIKQRAVRLIAAERLRLEQTARDKTAQAEKLEQVQREASDIADPRLVAAVLDGNWATVSKLLREGVKPIGDDENGNSWEPLKTTVFIQCPAVFARNFRVCPFFEQIALFSGLFVPHSSRIGPLQAHLGL